MIKATPRRLHGYIARYTAKYPGAWQKYDYFRSLRGKELPDWPSWCWCPLSGAHAIVSEGYNCQLPFDRLIDVGSLGALAAWRMTQGIYRFDTDIFNALWTTSLSKIPVKILYKLPEWCTYIEAPMGYKVDNCNLYGWFTYLEWDVKTGRTELRFVFDLEGILLPFILHLSAPEITECIELALSEGWQHASKYKIDKNISLPLMETTEKAVDDMTDIIAPVVSAVLYLCSINADVVDLHGKREKPSNPTPRKTKKGLRTFPLDGGVTTWLVGHRIGATLRLADTVDRHAGEGTEGSGRRSPRPHIRRAHWNLYWVGPKNKPQKPLLKWLVPIPVGVGKIVPTIRKVE